MKDTLSLQDLFHDRIFRVPDYQRGYAWEKQQVGEFLDDLALLDSSRRHYTGTIVLYQPPDAKEIEDNEGTSYVEVDVVDGQQRLTTTVLLLNEIAKALNGYASSSGLAQGIKKKYVEVKDIDGQPLHKLSLNEGTDNFFKTNVLPEKPSVAGPSVASAQRLLDAKKQIADYLNEAEGDQENRKQWLHELHSKMTRRLHFNLYEVEREAEVGIIFEVMNDRGKQLTDLEKVKNYLLYAASALDIKQDNRDKLAKSVNDAWAEILKRLMAAELGSSENENQLLRAHWLMEYDPQSRRWEGSKSVRGRFDLRKERHDQLLTDLQEYVQGLRNSCISFCDALRPNRGGDAFSAFTSSPTRDNIVLWNVKFARIGTTATFLPLLMAVRKRWPSEPKKYLEILKVCEAFAFRIYRAARYYASYRQSAMFHLASRVVHGMDFDDAVREIKRNYSSRESRHAFDDFTNEKSPQSWYGRTGIRYLLYEYESHLALARGGSPKVPWAEVEGADSVEHILPQYIGDRCYWQARFGADAHEEYKHDIGNLTLTKGNPSLGNKPFPDKKRAIDAKKYCYQESLLLEEREVAEKWDDWTVETINERRAMLLGWAKQRWDVDFSGIDGDAGEPSDGESEDEVPAP